MNPILTETVQKLMTPRKGILAADESPSSADKRLAEYGISGGEEGRRAFRDFLFSAPEIHEYLSGVILHDETLRQVAPDGRAFKDILGTESILLGIKVDAGKVPLPFFPEEEITEGLDGLGARFSEYREMGARFAKWRAVVKIGDGLPTDGALHANADALARYAGLAQDAGIVPIIEPEVLLGGGHSIEESGETLARTLGFVFDACATYRVSLSELILKTSMALSGSSSGIKDTPERVAEHTLRALKNAVPKETGGVVFLSGGQSPEGACENLRAICAHKSEMPWPMTFSFARALQEPALALWRGKEEKRAEGQKMFLETLRANAEALG